MASEEDPPASGMAYQAWSLVSGSSVLSTPLLHVSLPFLPESMSVHCVTLLHVCMVAAVVALVYIMTAIGRGRAKVKSFVAPGKEPGHRDGVGR